MSTKSKFKKDKISKLIEKGESNKTEKEFELSYYVGDRVKLMKEVLKIIKPRKIKNMAPDCIKDLDIEEINSMLLEELLGISNRRLKYIFIGQNLNEDSSSTDPEEEKHSIDIISLDDVSDDDFIDNDTEKSRRTKSQKRKPDEKIIKKEKYEKVKQKGIEQPLQEENLMSVLELLELQARARAIKSQLILETNKQPQQEKFNEDSDDTDDAVIIEQPKNDEIVITSDSENEQNLGYNKKIKPISNSCGLVQLKEDTAFENSDSLIQLNFNQTEETKKSRGNVENTSEVEERPDGERVKGDVHDDDDDIILIVDQDEIDGIMCE